MAIPVNREQSIRDLHTVFVVELHKIILNISQKIVHLFQQQCVRLAELQAEKYCNTLLHITKK